MRIAFIGSCQVHGMASAARRLLPDAEIVSFQVGVPHGPDEILARIAGFDIGISQVPDPIAGRPADPREAVSRAGLATILPAAIFFPATVFGGFHPDMVYLHREDGNLFGCQDEYHSQIVVAAFLNGLDEQRTQRLINSHVFAEFGYLDAYSAATAAVNAAYAEHGYDIAPHLDRWRADRTIFMHTINHPTIDVLSQMAVMALARLDLVPAGTQAPALIDDELAQAFIAPVFPPIARVIGTAASTTYRQSVVMAQGGPREIPLDAYIRGSFDIYRTCDPAWLEIHAARHAADRLRDLLA